MTTFDSSEMAKFAFNFWFSDNEHIRSPFPDYIQSELKQITEKEFQKWLDSLHLDASEEVDEEILAEKFEQILFESAIPLIKTEDERISILYPFLPRLGDSLKDDESNESIVTDRYLKKEADASFLQIVCEKLHNKEKWNTSFELTI